jgi:hypothetical protein
VETGVVVLEVKKFAAGLVEWNSRIGVAGLKTDFEATPSVEVSRNGCRIENAILRCLPEMIVGQQGRWR